MSERRHLSARDGGLSERERTKIEGRFGNVLALLFVAVFFSIAAPEGPWAFLLTTAVLATTLAIAMLASGVRRTATRFLCASRSRRLSLPLRPHGASS